MMKILILLTGGTFGSISENNRLSAAKPFSRLADLGNLAKSSYHNDVELVFSQPFSKLSENVVPSDWSTIYSAILKEKGNFDGVLIVHGTDTMAYTAAAISYLNALTLGVPIVITGANHPISMPGSDAEVNFIQSIGVLKYLARNNINGCFVVFNGKDDVDRTGRIHVGTRVKKDKWDDYCYRSYYSDGVSIGEIVGAEVSRFEIDQYSSLLKKQKQFELSTPDFDSSKIFSFKIYPGLYPFILPTPRNGINFALMELYNSGTGPADASEFSLVTWVKRFVDEGGAVFAVSQHEGKFGVSMDIYESSERLLSAGVIPLSDTIWEAAVPKLMLAASNYKNISDIVDFMRANIAGEILSA